MADNKNTGTTNPHRIGIDVDLGNDALRESFEKSARGIHDPEALVRGVKGAIAEDDVVVEYVEDGQTKLGRRAGQEHIQISQTGFSISKTLHVPDENIPANIPDEVTPELMSHLSALHEAEHATQYDLREDAGTGRISLVFDTGIREMDGQYLLMRDVVFAEADADLAVVAHLQDMEYEHVGQFYLDMRAGGAMAEHLVSPATQAQEHDTAFIVNHFDKTGETVDIENFMREKEALADKIKEQMGIDGPPNDVLFDYGVDKNVFYEEFDNGMAPAPQGIMHAVHSLLKEDGALEGIQQQEAQNYMDSMERLGYEADPNYDYEQQIRDVLENKLGLEPSSSQASNTHDQTESGLQNSAASIGLNT